MSPQGGIFSFLWQKQEQTMTPITIRPAQPNDLQPLHKMIEALAYFHGDLPSISQQTLEQILFVPAPEMTILVAEDGDKLVGYVALFPLFKLQFGARGLELHHMFVAENSRGQGVGHLLIDASVSQAKFGKYKYLSVGIHPDNIAAQDIYLANGFETSPIVGPRFHMVLT
jgi:GNAT superfamily N-acetyltransferase